jgi:glutathione S-transferase
VLPEPRTPARYQVQNALNWVASELHASVGPLFVPTLSAEVRAWCKTRAEGKFQTFNDLLLKGGKKFLVGNAFTVADSYAYVVSSWTPYLGIELAAYPAVKAYFDGIAALPNVVAAQARMGTAPATIR